MCQRLGEPSKLALISVDVLARKEHLIQGAQIILTQGAAPAVQPPLADTLNVKAVQAWEQHNHP